jgi:hypothetical protein
VERSNTLGSGSGYGKAEGKDNPGKRKMGWALLSDCEKYEGKEEMEFLTFDLEDIEKAFRNNVGEEFSIENERWKIVSSLRYMNQEL